MAGSGSAHLREGKAVLRVESIVKRYGVKRRGSVHALDDVSFDILAGETLGVVGESGCGKSTLARSILMLPPPTSGTVYFESAPISELSPNALLSVRPRLQPIFQDPSSSPNPRHRILDIVAAPLHVNGIGRRESRRERAAAMLSAVGLDPDAIGTRFPHELSGGQCQRVSIARALVLQPTLLICDEPVASLDVSVQAQVVNLIEKMTRQFALTVLFISHDLGVIKSISDRVLVMYLGKICEVGPAAALFRRPRHPYTASLLDAIPSIEPAQRKEVALNIGEMPSPFDVPSGCRFHPRCPRATHVCRKHEPNIRSDGEGTHFACHHPR